MLHLTEIHAVPCSADWKWLNIRPWHMRSCHVSFNAKTPWTCYGSVQEQLVSCTELKKKLGKTSKSWQSKKKMFWKAFGRHCSSSEHWSESKWETCNNPTENVSSSPLQTVVWTEHPEIRNKRPVVSFPHIPLELCTLWNQDCVKVCLRDLRVWFQCKFFI